MERKAVVIINEQHSLFLEQKCILDREFDNWEFITVPAEGWTLDEMKNLLYNEWAEEYDIPDMDVTFVFASPIPFLIRQITAFVCHNPDYFGIRDCKVLHNDHREKKELPDGKIIQVVSSTGWQLV
jgi:hypothetical protein